MEENGELLIRANQGHTVTVGYSSLSSGDSFMYSIYFWSVEESILYSGMQHMVMHLMSC